MSTALPPPQAARAQPGRHSARRTRLIVFTSHPIQYQAPWFRAIAASEDYDLLVAFSHIPDPVQQAEGFGGAFEWDVPLREGYRWAVLPGWTFPGAPRFARRIARGVGDLLARARPDAALVLGWHELSLVQAVLACRRHRVPLIIRGESNDRRERSWSIRQIHRAWLRNFTVALAIGRANRGFYEKAGFPTARIVDAPYFVDNAWFATQSQERRRLRLAIRAAWGLPAEGAVALFAGKLEAKKRPLDFLAAVGKAQRRGAPVHALLVGDGPLRGAAERLICEQAIAAACVGFLNQSRMPDAYVASDFLVLPSDHGETWGLVVNEAMASGLTAIVSEEAGCANDLVLEGETGLVFPCGDIERLSEAVYELSTQCDSRAALAARARERVLGCYGVERAMSALSRAVDLARGAPSAGVGLEQARA